MTVKRLIELLSGMSPNAYVYIGDGEGTWSAAIDDCEIATTWDGHTVVLTADTAPGVMP